MSRSTELVCPSGLRVKFRSIKGKDIDALRDRRRAATGESVTDLLDNCTVEVIDRGIYAGLPNFTWADALIGDNTAAVIGLRCATSGSQYDFRVRCQDSNCRQMIDWTLDLNDLPRKELPEESRKVFLAGNRFELHACDRDIVFKLMTGRDQASLKKFLAQLQLQQKKNGPRSESHVRTMLALAARIVSVEGTDDITSWLEDQDIPDLGKLIRAMDACDCGVETGIEVECAGRNGCGLQQEVQLPLDQTFFGQDF